MVWGLVRAKALPGARWYSWSGPKLAAWQNGNRLVRSRHVLSACGPSDLFLLGFPHPYRSRQPSGPNGTEIRSEAQELPLLNRPRRYSSLLRPATSCVAAAVLRHTKQVLQEACASPLACRDVASDWQQETRNAPVGQIYVRRLAAPANHRIRALAPQNLRAATRVALSQCIRGPVCACSHHSVK